MSQDQKPKLFQYAILWHPNKKEVEEGKKSVVLAEITTILATDAQEVLLGAGRKIPEAYQTQLDQVEVAVRPF
jgi:hypothetical protein